MNLIIFILGDTKIAKSYVVKNNFFRQFLLFYLFLRFIQKNIKYISLICLCSRSFVLNKKNVPRCSSKSISAI